MKHGSFRTVRWLAAAVVCVPLLVAPVAGQSLLSNRGLGLPVEPRTTRGSSLGGVSLGLLGYELSWADPAAAVGLPAGGIVTAFSFDNVSIDYAGVEGDATVARFPLLLAAFPFGSRWAVMAGMGGYLDQNWSLQRSDSIRLAADTIATRVVDRIASEGGVARLRAGAAYRLVPGLSVGLGVDVFTGGVTRTEGRMFGLETTPRCCRAQWEYSGVGMLASANWAPNEALRLALSASKGGTLEAEGRDSLTESRSYSLPTSVELGLSARLAPSLMVAASGDWTGWSSVEADLVATEAARDAWSLQGGVEWEALRLGSRVIPIRLGARTAALPFGAPDAADSWSSERAFTGGLGFVFGGGAATIDAGIERGSRSGDGFADESFWRFMASVSVLGQ